MMHDELISFETAKLAKEKGFRERCIEHYYDDTKDLYRSSTPQCYNFGGNTSDAPTQSLLQRWLREEKYLFANVGMAFNGYYYQVIRTDKFDECIGTQIIEHFNGNKFDTYELALEDALKYALENLV